MFRKSTKISNLWWIKPVRWKSIFSLPKKIKTKRTIHLKNQKNTKKTTDEDVCHKSDFQSMKRQTNEETFLAFYSLPFINSQSGLADWKKERERENNNHQHFYPRWTSVFSNFLIKLELDECWRTLILLFECGFICSSAHVDKVVDLQYIHDRNVIILILYY